MPARDFSWRYAFRAERRKRVLCFIPRNERKGIMMRNGCGCR